jgi:membrane protease YdiL (CAAX protease family)
MVSEMHDDDKPINAAARSGPATKFCSFCGAPWPPDASRCPACDPRAQLATSRPDLSVAFSPSSKRDDGRGVAEAALLYSLLLAASIGSALFTIHEVTELNRVLLAYFLMAPAVLVMAMGSGDVLTSAIRARLRLTSVLLTVAAAVCTLGAAAASHAVLSNIITERQSTLVEALGIGGQSWPLQLLVVAAVPAVLEEISFRGMILPYLSNRMPAVAALVVSAAAFAALHLNIVLFPFLICMGLVLGWLRIATGSLIPPIVAHFLHNAAVLALEATI